MRHDEFIGHVQDRARLPSRGDAEGATRATLETLGERIPETVAAKLAAELPQEIGEHLRRTISMGGAGTGERFDQDEFVDRVAQRDHTDQPAATYRARVVFEVLREATAPGLIDNVRSSLPGDLRELVSSGSSGALG